MELEEKEPQIDKTDSISDKGKRRVSTVDQIKDPTFRSKLYRWLCLPIGTFTLGIIDSQAGATFHDLQIITSTDEETAGLFFTAVNLGYMLGSLFGGFWFGKINCYLMMFAASVLAGAATVTSPYCPTFVLMFLIRCIGGFFLGVILCCSSAEHMRLWGTKGEALLQVINCTYAVGGVVGPLVSSPFLTEKATNKTLPHQNVTHSPLINYTETTNSTLPQTTNVHYAYLIAGAVLTISAIPFLLVLINPETASSHSKEEDAIQESSDRKLPLGLKVFLLVNICSYFVAYICVEMTFFSYVAAFVEDQFEEVNSQRAAYIATFFWASFAAARFLSIFTSKYVTAIRLLYLHLSLVLIALSGFLVSALYCNIEALTAFTCTVGLACSANYAASMSWVEAEIMTVTGPVSAAILIAGTTGAMANPFVVGHLMQKVSNLWFCYILMISIGLALLFFVFLLIFNRFYVDKKYGKVREVRVLDKQNHSPVIRIETVF